MQTTTSKGTPVEVRLFAPRSVTTSTSDLRIGVGILRIPPDSKAIRVRVGETFTLEGLTCEVDEKYPGNENILASARLEFEGLKEEVQRLKQLGFEFNEEACRRKGVPL